jgi:hypothetical protein
MRKRPEKSEMEASPEDGKDRGVTARSSAHCRLDVVPYLIVLCESLPFKQSVAPSDST